MKPGESRTKNAWEPHAALGAPLRITTLDSHLT